jgi:hypothetical protein
MRRYESVAAALAGKSHRADFRSGNGVTDAGLARLHELPVFESWRGGDTRMSLLGFDACPNFLTLRGPFTMPALPTWPAPRACLR